MSKKKSRAGSAFGEKLRSWRKKRKITMKLLADQLDVSESYISRLESGERHPDKDLILKLGPVLFPEGNQAEMDQLLIAADYTPIHLDKKTGHDDLISHFEKVLETEPENFRAFNALVISLIKQGKYALARQRIEEGLQKYDASIHLQILMGNLELVQGNAEKALLYQQEALNTIEQNPEEAQRLFLRRNDSLLNLAVIYFLMGYEQVGVFLQSQQTADYEAARKPLLKASESLQEALAIDADDIYVLDEYARVQFNLAYLKQSAGKTANYEEAIQAFEKVVHSEEKARLNYSDLMESALFLVHAYAKSRQFTLAEQHIHIVECCLPNFWLVHYIKACVYNLKFLQEPDPQWLEIAIRSLERAMAISDKGNRTPEEAPYDPDLQAIKDHYPARFKKLFKPEALL